MKNTSEMVFSIVSNMMDSLRYRNYIETIGNLFVLLQFYIFNLRVCHRENNFLDNLCPLDFVLSRNSFTREIHVMMQLTMSLKIQQIICRRNPNVSASLLMSMWVQEVP